MILFFWSIFVSVAVASMPHRRMSATYIVHMRPAIAFEREISTKFANFKFKPPSQSTCSLLRNLLLSLLLLLTEFRSVILLLSYFSYFVGFQHAVAWRTKKKRTKTKSKEKIKQK